MGTARRPSPASFRKRSKGHAGGMGNGDASAPPEPPEQAGLSTPYPRGTSLDLEAAAAPGQQTREQLTGECVGEVQRSRVAGRWRPRWRQVHSAGATSTGFNRTCQAVLLSTGPGEAQLEAVVEEGDVLDQLAQLQRQQPQQPGARSSSQQQLPPTQRQSPEAQQQAAAGPAEDALSALLP